MGFEPTPTFVDQKALCLYSGKLTLESGALDHSAILTLKVQPVGLLLPMALSLTVFPLKRYLAAVGFEPTPPKRLVPKTSALDHSATLPLHLEYGRREQLRVRGDMA